MSDSCAPLVTLFTTPKPFREPIATLQRNALRSWAALGPDVQVLLMGDEPGARETAGDLGLRHIPDIGRNAYGTPRMDLLFEQAEALSSSRLLCYINCDIVLMDDFLGAVREVARRKRQFLMVGRRMDYDQHGPIDFAGDWQAVLRDAARAQGRLNLPVAIDYFLFNRGMWGGLAPMAIGRYVWDNWLIYRARQRRVPVIDATPRVLAVHQNHDYGHVVGGSRGIANGPEARYNMALAGGKRNLYTIWDATHELTADGLRPRGADPGTLGGGIWSYRRSSRFGAA